MILNAGMEYSPSQKGSSSGILADAELVAAKIVSGLSTWDLPDVHYHVHGNMANIRDIRDEIHYGRRRREIEKRLPFFDAGCECEGCVGAKTETPPTFRVDVIFGCEYMDCVERYFESWEKHDAGLRISNRVMFETDGDRAPKDVREK